jgi:hypothetical protein
VYECYDPGDGTLRRVAETGLPNADPARVKDAFAFHEEIRLAVEAHQKDETYRRKGYKIYPIVGQVQPTNQSARRKGNAVEIAQTIRGEDPGGDGTVPRPSAFPREQEDASAGMFAATKHASLQNADAVLNQLSGVITGLYLDLGDFRAVESKLVRVALALDDIYRAGDRIEIRARPSMAAALGATFVEVESGAEVAKLALTQATDGWHAVEFKPPQPGAYRVTVTGQAAGVEPAADAFEVVQIP